MKFLNNFYKLIKEDCKAPKFQEFPYINIRFPIISLETLESRASGEKIEPQNDIPKFSSGGLIIFL